MGKIEPIETEIGILRGRDCVFLDRISMSSLQTLGLIGEINCSNVFRYRPPCDQSRNKQQTSDREFLPFVLKFHRILGLEMLDLDAWFSQNNLGDGLVNSSFEQVLDSDWIQTINPAIVGHRKHFRIGTYDTVFEVICETFSLTFPVVKTRR